jgi:hypothetical protein
MQQEPFTEIIQDSPESTHLERGQYSMLLHNEMSADGSIFFSLPDQDGYLYEYEGDLDEALDDLPEIAIALKNELQQPVTLTPEAAIVVEQLWNHFDQTKTQKLEGEQDYDFRIEEDWLLIVPKESSEEVVAISRDGQVQSSFAPERYEHLMERCAIAYENSIDPAYGQTQGQQFQQIQQNDEQNWELG